MKTKTLVNGNTKEWHDREEEFLIVNKNQPLFDTILDANLIPREYCKMLLKEVSEAGLNDIHEVFIDLDDSLQSQMDTMDINELDMIFDSFNSIFTTKFKYHKNSNGLISVIFGQFNNYQEFRRNYFCTFLLKMFAGQIDLLKTEEENLALQGLTEFIRKYADEYMKIYMEISKTMKFAWVINFDY
jgi:hypothetical protein